MEKRAWKSFIVDGVASPTGVFCHAVSVEVGPGVTYVHTSGITSRNADGVVVGEGDIEAQTRQVLSKLADVLRGVGCSLGDVLKLLVFVTDMNGFDSIHSVRQEFFEAPYPASTMVEVERLVDERLMIEIEAVAVRLAEV